MPAPEDQVDPRLAVALARLEVLGQAVQHDQPLAALGGDLGQAPVADEDPQHPRRLAGGATADRRRRPQPLRPRDAPPEQPPANAASSSRWVPSRRATSPASTNRASAEPTSRASSPVKRATSAAVDAPTPGRPRPGAGRAPPAGPPDGRRRARPPPAAGVNHRRPPAWPPGPRGRPPGWPYQHGVAGAEVGRAARGRRRCRARAARPYRGSPTAMSSIPSSPASSPTARCSACAARCPARPSPRAPPPGVRAVERGRAPGAPAAIEPGWRCRRR